MATVFVHRVRVSTALIDKDGAAAAGLARTPSSLTNENFAKGNRRGRDRHRLNAPSDHHQHASARASATAVPTRRASRVVSHAAPRFGRYVVRVTFLQQFADSATADTLESRSRESAARIERSPGKIPCSLNGHGSVRHQSFLMAWCDADPFISHPDLGRWQRVSAAPPNFAARGPCGGYVPGCNGASAPFRGPQREVGRENPRLVVRAAGREI